MHFITSPFFVVPLLAVVFLSCILTATLTGRKQFHESTPDESSPHPDTH
jgi:hypothetical protein